MGLIKTSVCTDAHTPIYHYAPCLRKNRSMEMWIALVACKYTIEFHKTDQDQGKYRIQCDQIIYRTVTLKTRPSRVGEE